MNILAIKEAIEALKNEGVTIYTAYDNSVAVSAELFMKTFDFSDIEVITEGSRDYPYHLKANCGGLFVTAVFSKDQFEKYQGGGGNGE